MSCGASGVANTTLDDLLVNDPLDLPSFNLNDPAFKPPSSANNPLYEIVNRLTNEDLTTRTVDGAGTFDAIMSSLGKHLKLEYDKGRITGAEYSKTFIALTESAMSQGVAFLLGRDQAYWAAVNAQMQAINGRVQLELSKAQLAIAVIEAKNQRANYALTKMRLAGEDIQYCISKYNLEQILPLQRSGLEVQNQTTVYTLNNMLPSQKNLVESQRVGVDRQNNISDYTLNQLMPEQKRLLVEQLETQRAQTLDHRLDGTPIVGQVGKQKQLYDQQITSYKRSAELGAARVWADAWMAHKAIDEGIDTPASFNSSTVSGVMATLKLNNLL